METENEARLTRPVERMVGLATDPELLALLERSRSHVMTAEEIFEQRVSWCYGMQGSRGQQFSKEEIREMLLKVDGRPNAQVNRRDSREEKPDGN